MGYRDSIAVRFVRGLRHRIAVHWGLRGFALSNVRYGLYAIVIADRIEVLKRQPNRYSIELSAGA